jgi:MFS family permease
LKAGVTFVATAGTAVVSAVVAQALTTRVGVKPVTVVGLLLLTGGMLWYAQIPVHGRFVPDLLPGYLLVGVGIAFSFVPVSIAALAGVGASDAGLASGLINTAQQIGGAIGVAIASTLWTSHFNNAVKAGTSVPVALTDGYKLAFWVIAGLGVAALVAALALIRREELVEPEALATAEAR